MKTELSIQQENINELVRLQKENPNARVMCFVSEECCSSDYSYQASSFGKPRFEKMFLIDDLWIDDEDYVRERIADDLFDDGKIDDFTSDEDIEILVDKEFKNYEGENIISVYINAM